ncbi:hypothetical protein IN07_24145 [Modestobacter caceresii]|uniref:Terminase n=1 Tax=Modestobacter caceresii TaxID=1522368 RepID=A0A098Y3S7_9ACTN|nr:hypothetical protein [Modestobacter caceresii]KGH43232.1 hypothetical protein IN07_24145 [Modestobacter caceresii]
MTETRAPAGLRTSGRRLWQAVVSSYELAEHERALLIEACRTLDLLDRLDTEVRRDGPVIQTPQGLRAHPAAVEARQQRLTYGRLLAALRLPDDDTGDQPASSGRPQRRGGARGFYSLPGGAS